MVQFTKHFWIVIGLMAITFAANRWIRAPKASTGQNVDIRLFPKQIEGWHAEELEVDEGVESVLGIDQTLLRTYVNSKGDRVELFIGYYQDQKFGAQIHSPQHCIPGSGWTILRQERFRLPGWREDLNYAKRLQISRNRNNQMVVYWFSSSGNVVDNEFVLKSQLLINSLTRQLTSVCFYRICVPFPENEEGRALRALQEFLAAASPEFDL